MEQFSIEVSDRSQTGSANNRRLRTGGQLPSVVYSHGEGSFPVVINEREFVRLAEKSTSAQVFSLKSGNSKLNGRLAIVKEVQINRLKGRVLHVDFQALKDNEEITVLVPLKFVGIASGVKDDGGILSVSSHALSVACLPRSIPSVIEVDVTALKIGDSIHARDLKLPNGVKLAGKIDETIVSVVIVKQIVEAAPAADAAAADGTAVAADGAAAPAEGAAAAPAEGGADAKKDDKGAKAPAAKAPAAKK